MIIVDFLDRLSLEERARVLVRFQRAITPGRIREQVQGKSRLANHKPARSKSSRMYVVIPSISIGNLGSTAQLWIRFEVARAVGEELLRVAEEHGF